MTAQRSLFQSFLRFCWFSLAAVLIAAAVLLSAARLLLPMAGDYHDDLAQWVGGLLGHPVRITGLGASWHGLGPSIELEGVTVLDATGEQALLQCDSARVDIDVLASLRHWQIELGQLTVRGAHLSLLRQADGSLSVMGIGELTEAAPDPAAQAAFKQWLARQRRLSMEESTVHWRDLSRPAEGLTFSGVKLQLRNRGLRHRLEAEVALPAQLGRRLDLIADVRGDLFNPAGWDGELFVRGEALNMAGWGGYAWPGVVLREARADFMLWSAWRDGLRSAGGNLSASDVRFELMSEGSPDVPAPVRLVTVAHVQGQFQWQHLPGGWLLDLDRFSLQNESEAGLPGQVRINFRRGGEGARPQIEVAFSQFDLAQLLRLARESGGLGEAQDARLAALAPRGLLRNAYLRYQWGAEAPPALLLRGDFEQLAFSPHGTLPGVSGLSGHWVSDSEQGMIDLDGGAGALDASQLFRTPLPLAGVQGRLVWRRAGESWQVVSRGLRLVNEDIHGQVAFRLIHTAGVSTPYLDLHATFADGKGERASRYLPAKHMPAKTVSWLDRAIVSGRVTQGAARFEGWLNEFPFDHGAGRFEVGFHVSGGVLDYAPGWPRLEGIETDVSFLGRRFEAQASAAKSLSAAVTRAKVVIADLAAHPAIVSIDGEARGPTAAALRYVLESPLRDKLGGYLAGMRPEGRSRLKLALLLPLGPESPSRVDGVLSFDDSSLSLPGTGVDLTRIRGDLGFYEAGLRPSELRLRILGQPAVVKLRDEGEGAEHVTLFEAQGHADSAAMAKKFLPLLASRVTGVAPWRGELRLTSPVQGGARLHLQSSLQGVALRLPSPFNKEADDERVLSLDMPLPLSDGESHLRFAELADARWQMAARAGGEPVLRRGELRLGGEAAVLPEDEQLRVRGSLARFAPAEWAAVWRSAPAQAAAKTAPAEDLKVELDLAAAELVVLGQRFPDVELHAVRRAAAWEAVLDSQRVAGKLRVPDELTLPVVADMARLYLAAPQDKPAEAPDAASGLDPRDLPPVQLHALDFRFGELALGELSLRTTRSERGMVVEEIKARSPVHRTDISGRWEQVNGVQRSAFNLAFESDDVGETLRAAGYADVIKAGKMHIGMDLLWPGSPADFALARAQGTIALKIKDGRLLEVSPGAGRILGLLSFQALPRRLTLDFSDLFQKGFAFDRIEGNFTVENGNALTDNLTMDGPSAHITARGRIGLATEDYDQRVTVIPNVSGGLPLAGAIAGGVVTGAALLLVERLFKPQIDSVGRVEYRVTGPWTAPRVERIGGVVAVPDKPEEDVSLPQPDKARETGQEPPPPLPDKSR